MPAPDKAAVLAEIDDYTRSSTGRPDTEPR
jgi:hypothetical protein